MAETTSGRQAFGAEAPPSRDHWAAKVEALMAAWWGEFGEGATRATAVLACAVAQHETRCGDAWPGENNWGAIQLRVLRPEEAGVLSDAGWLPDPSAVAKARRALAAVVVAGTVPAEPRGALHVDSSPVRAAAGNPRGWYWVYFQAFPDEAQGARAFVKVLTGARRPNCRKILEDARLGNAADAQALATEMYRTGYYEGFHDPKTADGRQQNIDDYSRALIACVAMIEASLGDWQPPLHEDAQAAVAQVARDANLTSVEENLVPDHDSLPVPDDA